MKIVAELLKILFPWVEKKEIEKDPMVITKFVNANGAVTDVVVEFNPWDRVVISCAPNDGKKDQCYFSLDELKTFVGIFGSGMERDFNSLEGTASKVISHYYRS